MRIVNEITVIVISIFALFACTKQVATDKNLSSESIQKKALTIVNSIKEPVIPDVEWNMIEFSGETPKEYVDFDYRDAINSAIDSLSKMGGGTIVFSHPEGPEKWIKQTVVYGVSGPVLLKDNICLSFDPSVLLQFQFAPEKYTNNGLGFLTRYEGTTLYGYGGLIRGFNAKNIIIKFKGGNGAMPTIHGDGMKWQKWQADGDEARKNKGLLTSYELIRKINNDDLPIAERKYGKTDMYLRPCLMEFLFCENVLVEGLKLEDSPFWVVHPVFSKNCIFRNIVYDCPVVNNDGIDPESSKNVLIENIIFNNHDDNVAIKSGRDKEGRDGAIIKGTELEEIESDYINNGRLGGKTENVVVRNCAFKGHHAFCIGSECSGGAENIFVVNNYAVQEVNSGVYLKSSRKRGGLIQNVYVDNLKIQYVAGDAISIIPNYDGDTISPYPPKFKKIYLSNIEIDSAQLGIRAHGWYDSPIDSVYMKNINIKKITNKIDFEYTNIRHLIIKDSNIEKKSIDGTYNNHDKKSKVPQKV